MVARVICGFPGVGKTHLSLGLDRRFNDVDYPTDYTHDSSAERIEQHMVEVRRLLQDTTDIIFIPDWQELRDAMVVDGIHFALVYPAEHLKLAYLARYVRRKNRGGFVGDMALHWENRIATCRAQTRCEHHVLLHPDQFLGDIIQSIIPQ